MNWNSFVVVLSLQLAALFLLISMDSQRNLTVSSLLTHAKREKVSLKPRSTDALNVNGILTFSHINIMKNVYYLGCSHAPADGE